MQAFLGSTANVRCLVLTIMLGFNAVSSGCYTNPRVYPIVFREISINGERMSLPNKSAKATMRVGSSDITLTALQSIGTITLGLQKTKGPTQVEIRSYDVNPITEDFQALRQANTQSSLSLPQTLGSNLLVIQAHPDSQRTVEFRWVLELAEDGDLYMIEVKGTVDRSREIGPAQHSK